MTDFFFSLIVHGKSKLTQFGQGCWLEWGLRAGCMMIYAEKVFHKIMGDAEISTYGNIVKFSPNISPSLTKYSTLDYKFTITALPLGSFKQLHHWSPPTCKIIPSVRTATAFLKVNANSSLQSSNWIIWLDCYSSYDYSQMSTTMSTLTHVRGKRHQRSLALQEEHEVEQNFIEKGPFQH